jgi:hypothetical protein
MLTRYQKAKLADRHVDVLNKDISSELVDRRISRSASVLMSPSRSGAKRKCSTVAELGGSDPELVQSSVAGAASDSVSDPFWSLMSPVRVGCGNMTPYGEDSLLKGSHVGVHTQQSICRDHLTVNSHSFELNRSSEDPNIRNFVFRQPILGDELDQIGNVGADKLRLVNNDPAQNSRPKMALTVVGCSRLGSSDARPGSARDISDEYICVTNRSLNAFSASLEHESNDVQVRPGFARGNITDNDISLSRRSRNTCSASSRQESCDIQRVRGSRDGRSVASVNLMHDNVSRLRHDFPLRNHERRILCDSNRVEIGEVVKVSGKPLDLHSESLSVMSLPAISTPCPDRHHCPSPAVLDFSTGDEEVNDSLSDVSLTEFLVVPANESSTHSDRHLSKPQLNAFFPSVKSADQSDHDDRSVDQISIVRACEVGCKICCHGAQITENLTTGVQQSRNFRDQQVGLLSTRSRSDKSESRSCDCHRQLSHNSSFTGQKRLMGGQDANRDSSFPSNNVVRVLRQHDDKHHSDRHNGHADSVTRVKPDENNHFRVVDRSNTNIVHDSADNAHGHLHDVGEGRASNCDGHRHREHEYRKTDRGSADLSRSVYTPNDQSVERLHDHSFRKNNERDSRNRLGRRLSRSSNGDSSSRDCHQKRAVNVSNYRRDKSDVDSCDSRRRDVSHHRSSDKLPDCRRHDDSESKLRYCLRRDVSHHRSRDDLPDSQRRENSRNESRYHRVRDKSEEKSYDRHRCDNSGNESSFRRVRENSQGKSHDRRLSDNSENESHYSRSRDMSRDRLTNKLPDRERRENSGSECDHRRNLDKSEEKSHDRRRYDNSENELYCCQRRDMSHGKSSDKLSDRRRRDKSQDRWKHEDRSRYCRIYYKSDEKLHSRRTPNKSRRSRHHSASSESSSSSHDDYDVGHYKKGRRQFANLMGLKLPKFSGEGDLDVFLHQFERAMQKRGERAELCI